MFSPEALHNYASVLLWGLQQARSKPFKKSDFIVIRFDIDALPLAEELCDIAHDKGFIPIIRLNPTPRMERSLYTKANNKRLTTLHPGEKELHAMMHGCINLLAPHSLTHLADIEPELISMTRRARSPLAALNRVREAAGEYSWTVGLWPTTALAQSAGLSLEDYTAQVHRACLLDQPEPVRSWRRLHTEINAVRQWLSSLGNVALHVEGDGIDLHLNVGEQRRWAAITGRNIPSFELYVSPDWRTVEGEYYANMPSFISGKTVRDVRLTLEKGRVVKARARQGGAFLQEQLVLDPGAAAVGEFALVDKRFSPINKFMATTLYDENYGGEAGSMHIALGQSYANTYAEQGVDSGGVTAIVQRTLGFNSSNLHWDLVSTAGCRVSAKAPLGKEFILYENGQFCY